MQTLADLGLIGVGLSLLATVAWVARGDAARPACGSRDRGLPFDPERIGLLTMATVVVVFAVHSLIDWTWFVPGNAVVALLCAGWVAGRRACAAARPRARRTPRAGARRPGASACAAAAWRAAVARSG